LKTGTAAWVCCARYGPSFLRAFTDGYSLFRPVMIRSAVGLHAAVKTGLRLRPPPERFDRPARSADPRRGNDRPTNAQVPERRDVRGDLRGRRVHILRFKKLADPIGHLDRLGIVRCEVWSEDDIGQERGGRNFRMSRGASASAGCRRVKEIYSNVLSGCSAWDSLRHC
jgi:hypothetical protein